MRRILNINLLKSRRSRISTPRQRNNAGITKSLEIMVLIAIAATITMPVAAEKPPINTINANVSLPLINGNVRTYKSSCSPGINKIPVIAMGTTTILVKIK